MEHKIIFETANKQYRIVEILDSHYDLECLKGDCFNAVINTDIPAERLRREELEFEREVFTCGVYGYCLERWNSAPGKGYESVDSCFGFVGKYNSKNENTNHYIVEELKNQIPEQLLWESDKK